MNASQDDDTIAWLPDPAGVSGPIYLAVADAIGAAIASGALLPGTRLPTHRALAQRLGVDLTTATRSYAEAQRRGLLDATVGRGTFVRGRAPAPASRTEEASGPVDLSMNMPPQPAEPALRDLLQRGFSTLLARPDVHDILTYRTGAGSAEERAAGAAWLRPTLGEVDPGRLLVCPGAQHALAVALALLARRDAVVLTDPCTYLGLRNAAAQLGLVPHPVAGDAEGMDPDALDQACAATGAQLLYLIPTIQNPMATTMTPARRAAIVGVARRRGLHIVEDDAYGLLPSSPLPALASLAPERTFHVATVSKVLNPALCVAYLVAPDGDWAARLAAALRAQVLMASPLLTGLMTLWLQDGTALALRDAVRREAASRQRMASEILPEGSFDAHPEGLHLWLSLPPRWDRLDFAAHLRRRDGLAVVPSDAFAIGSAPPPGRVRVSLGAARGQESLRRALRTLAEVLREDEPASFSGVV